MKNDLLNYWNLRQVVYVRGIKQPSFDEQFVFKKLVEQELIQCFEKIPEEYNFENMQTDFLMKN
jgi:hypothetical protein